MFRSRPGSRPSGRRVRDEVASGGRSDASHKGAANTQRRRRWKSDRARQIQDQADSAERAFIEIRSATV
ncbi:hypothetical protein NG2371_00882 [Nocardia gamkensis]|nr:hypothetical protein [Nocardia gamkensis]